MTKSPNRKSRSEPSSVISVRLTNEELSALELITRSHGFSSRNATLRTLIKAGGGLVEADATLIDEWKTTSRNLAQTGNLVNQLARAANRGGIIWDKDSREDFKTLRKQLLEVGILIGNFAKAAKMRTASKPLIDFAMKYSDE